jgi:hypothetical protein
MGPQVVKHRLDSTPVGMIAGVLGMVTGFFILAFVWSLMNKMSVGYFIDEIFIESDLFKDKIITVSVLFNVVVFWLANRAEWYRFNRGVLAVVLLAVPVIIYFN